MTRKTQLKQSIKTQLDGLSRLALNFNENIDEGRLHQISQELAKLDDDLREGIQHETADKMAYVIQKLDNDDEITPDELALIRLWMVSDAEFYVQLENDFRDWIMEVNRLFGHINTLNQGDINEKTMGEISGSIRDALRVIADIVYFRQEEHRIRRFERATATLNSEDKLHLSRLLRQKWRSGDA